jgi:hypothetical protein
MLRIRAEPEPMILRTEKYRIGMEIIPIRAEASLALHSFTPKTWRKQLVKITDIGSQSVVGKFRSTTRRSVKCNWACESENFGLNENHSFRSYGFTNIAGAGLEPATFGL